jgi:hypothetical protein
MSQNPFQPPVSDEPAPKRPRAPIDPALARQIEEHIKRLNRNSLLFGGAAVFLQFVGQFTDRSTRLFSLLAGTGLLIYGFSLYAKMRNRSGWWSLLGLFSCLGFVVLLFLPKTCHNCGATTKGKTCAECGAPAPM